MGMSLDVPVGYEIAVSVPPTTCPEHASASTVRLMILCLFLTYVATTMGSWDQADHLRSS
jgi:hypothetical protein